MILKKVVVFLLYLELLGLQKKLGLPEVGLIQLAVRDSLIKEGFRYEVKLSVA
jgi:hypothetical protein